MDVLTKIVLFRLKECIGEVKMLKKESHISTTWYGTRNTFPALPKIKHELTVLKMAFLKSGKHEIDQIQDASLNGLSLARVIRYEK